MGDPASVAHLTGTLQTAPSLFELLSVENFALALRSAVLHVTKFVASRNPEHFGFLFRNFDELFLLVDGLLQLQYLKTKRGTLSEAFYGLQRLGNVPGERIRILPSLLACVLIPYASSKAKNLYNKLREEQSTVEWKQLYVKFYPILRAFYGVVRLYKFIKYSLGRSMSHDLILDMLSLRVGYTSPNQGLNPSKDMKPLKWILLTAGESILWFIEIGSFFVQFLETYTSKRGSLPTTLPTPDVYKSGNKLDKIKCPICYEKRKNPATLSTSGITFCYGCIAKYLQQFKRCPVTNIPSNANHIIRIFYT